MQHILVLGANSDIALDCIYELCEHSLLPHGAQKLHGPCTFYLTVRNNESFCHKLAQLKEQYEQYGHRFFLYYYDSSMSVEEQQEFCRDLYLARNKEPLDLCLCAIGLLHDSNELSLEQASTQYQQNLQVQQEVVASLAQQVLSKQQQYKESSAKQSLQDHNKLNTLSNSDTLQQDEFTSSAGAVNLSNTSHYISESEKESDACLLIDADSQQESKALLTSSEDIQKIISSSVELVNQQKLAGSDSGALNKQEQEQEFAKLKEQYVQQSQELVRAQAQAEEQIWQDEANRLCLAQEVIQANFSGLLPILSLQAAALKKQNSGTLMVISSVAGLRGRSSNYIYGASKAALNAYLSGLRQELASTKVKVSTIMPGLVETKMISQRHHHSGYFTLSSKDIAHDVVQAYIKGTDIVMRKRYRLLMTLVRLLPERIFKHLRT